MIENGERDGYILAVDGGVARITLNRPQVRNSIDPAMMVQLNKDLQLISSDRTIRCVVFSGAGGHFCSGADMGYFGKLFGMPEKERLEALTDGVASGGEWMETLESMPQPVVASIRGAVGGSGMAFVCAADFVIASENSFFTVAHVKIGGSPDGGSTYYLPRLIGVRQAKKLCMLGDRFDAHQAHQLGLVTELVADDQLETATEALVDRLSHAATQALAGAKALINDSFNNQLGPHLRLEAEWFGKGATTTDFIEGVTAFVEKRKPAFTGN